MKTSSVRLPERALRQASVKHSQPMPRCERAAPGATVKIVFRSSTPWRAHGPRSPVEGQCRFRSRSSSPKMRRSDGGKPTPIGTEKASPSASPLRGYGSCPRMTTFTFGKGVSSKARRTFCGEGKKGRPAAERERSSVASSTSAARPSSFRQVDSSVWNIGLRLALRHASSLSTQSPCAWSSTTLSVPVVSAVEHRARRSTPATSPMTDGRRPASFRVVGRSDVLAPPPKPNPCTRKKGRKHRTWPGA
jgi:hypothetical protein